MPSGRRKGAEAVEDSLPKTERLRGGKGHRGPPEGRLAPLGGPPASSRNRRCSDRRSIRLRVAGLRVATTGGGSSPLFSGGAEFVIRALHQKRGQRHSDR
jgi:hypothetical protein